MKLAGWGRFPRVDCRLLGARGAEQVQAALQAAPSLIARGNGRAYGDAALNPHATLSMLPADRILAFDQLTGRVTCEAGMMLADLLSIVVPAGWFPPVTPGTRFVTVGGMIAADVHGKNHHLAGSFCDHVEDLELMRADGVVVRCSPNVNAELFAATRGGMGLTGVILSASFRLKPIETAWIRQETLRADGLEAAMELLEASSAWTYTVAWIDCQARGRSLGRSLLYRGEHARPQELSPEQRAAALAVPGRRARRIPFDFPSFVVNRWSTRAFNELYWRRAVPGSRVVDLDTFFYPLDGVLEWNRAYGSAGFTQYQCVLPREAAGAGLRSLLGRTASAGKGSFLAVLKLLGPQEGLLSFPLEGYTLALDFPVDPPTLSLLVELDAIVADHGGRLYLAKDARMGAALLRRGYPGLDRFRALREAHDPARKFRSILSKRLDL